MGDFTQVAEATALIVICVMAFIGNGSLFWIVTRKRELRTLLNLFVLNLAAADMLVSFASMPLTAASIISEGWILERTACVAFGFITIVSFISSVMSLGMIAISRYFYIVKWQTNNTTFTIARGTLCVVFVWLTAMALASPPLFNWAEYRYIPGKSYCFVYWQADVYYMYFMIATCFFGPLTVMAISYFRILSFTRKHKKQLAIFRRKHNTQETESGPPYTRSMNTLRVSAEEAKITNTLLIVVAFFIFCWTPFAITMFLYVYYPHPLPRGVDFSSLLLGYANSMFNPIFYGIRNASFRKGFKELFFKCLPCMTSQRTFPE